MVDLQALSVRAQGISIATCLLEQSSLLDDVGNGLHLDTFGLVDVFESVEVAGLFVLYDTDLDTTSERLNKWPEKKDFQTNLAKGTLSNTAQEHKVKEVNLTLKVNRLVHCYLSFQARCDILPSVPRIYSTLLPYLSGAIGWVERELVGMCGPVWSVDWRGL
jgi:hypothetical protein